MSGIMESLYRERIIYLFDDTKLFTDARIEEGAAQPNSSGKILDKLEVSLESPDASQNDQLQEIIKDCVQPEIVSQGYPSCLNFLKAMRMPTKSLGYVNPSSDTILIYTIQQ